MLCDNDTWKFTHIFHLDPSDIIKCMMCRDENDVNMCMTRMQSLANKGLCYVSHNHNNFKPLNFFKGTIVLHTKPRPIELFNIQRKIHM